MTSEAVPASDSVLAAAQALVPEIRTAADIVEAERRLPPALVAALVDAGLFRLLVPAALGGLEIDLPNFLHIVELLAGADAAVGWCVMVGAQLGGLAAFLTDDAADEVFARSPRVITAGVAAPSGQALAADGGYRVSGRWAFASGCQHADWLYGGCRIFDGDAPRSTPQGTTEVRLMLFPSAECELIDTWDVTGLRGTGSHDFAVRDLFVPDHRTVVWPALASPRYSGPLYRLPVLPLISQASHPLGVARRALDVFRELATTKTALGTVGPLREQAVIAAEVGRAEALVGAGRAYLAETSDDLWATLLAGEEPTLEQRGRVRLAMTLATRNAVEAIDTLYTLAGSSAIHTRNTLERLFRDVHTSAAHWTVGPRQYEAAGRIVLGLPPGPAFF